MTWGRRNPNWKKGMTDLHIPLEKKKDKQRAAIDSNFLRQIYRILKILIPNAMSKEVHIAFTPPIHPVGFYVIVD